MDSTSCWGGARGVKTCHVTSFWGGGGVLHVSCTSMRKKNSIITTDPFHIYYKIYYIFRSHGMPLFFSSKSMSKDMIIKMSCNAMAKEEKKVNLHAMCSWVCYVIGGGNVSFLNLIPIAGTSGGKKNRNLRSQLFFPTGRGNESCMQYTVDLILYFLIKIYKINIKSITS